MFSHCLNKAAGFCVCFAQSENNIEKEYPELAELIDVFDFLLFFSLFIAIFLREK